MTALDEAEELLRGPRFTAPGIERTWELLRRADADGADPARLRAATDLLEVIADDMLRATVGLARATRPRDERHHAFATAKQIATVLAEATGDEEWLGGYLVACDAERDAWDMAS